MQDVHDAAKPPGWRFGRYQLCIGQRRLTRDGQPVVVEERAFDLLVYLAQHHDREVDRREVTAALWGQRPVSDTTLRQLVYRARQAVGDDGKRQDVIRTLHGRSLQWVAPLRVVAADSPASTSEPPSVGTVTDARSEASTRPVSTTSRRLGRWRWWWGGLAAVLVLMGGGLSVRIAMAPSRMRPLRIAIEPMRNQTGDPDLDWTRDGLPGLLAGLLAGTGGADVVDPVRAARVWAYPPQDGRDQAAQFRFTTGADVLVSGTLTRVTGQLLELAVTVTPATGAVRRFTVTGPKPGLLANDAVARVRSVLHLDAPAATGVLPTDPFLAEAYARGMDLSAHGNCKQAVEYFRLVAEGAPNFLGASLNLGICQVFTNDIKAGKATIDRLLSAAQGQHDSRMTMLALLWQARLHRDHDPPATALDGLRQVAAMAQTNHDAEIELEARAMLADVLDKVGQPDQARQELAAAAKLATQNPRLHDALAVYYDIASELANNAGDYTTALAIAQKVLALRESIGNQRGVLVSKFYVGQALYSLGRPMDALAVSARAYRDAVASGSAELRYALGSLVAVTALDAGLSDATLRAAAALVRMAQDEGSIGSRQVALRIEGLALLQRGDYAAALTSLHAAAALADPRQLAHADYFDQALYTAVATYATHPADVAGLARDLVANRDVFGSDARYARLRVRLQALTAAAVRHPDDALRALQHAALIETADDGDVAKRTVPLLIAVTLHEPRAAAIALQGFDAATATDAAVLPLAIRWYTEQGDTAAAARAEWRLATLRKQGHAALVAAGLDPTDPLIASTTPMPARTGTR